MGGFGRQLRVVVLIAVLCVPTLGAQIECLHSKKKGAGIPTGEAYSVTLTALGNGTLTISPESANNLWAVGTYVTITATGTTGDYFMEWAGDASGFANPLGVIVTRDLSVIGVFEPLGGRPLADFDFAPAPAQGTAPLVVDFTDLSSHSPTEWEWDFGDGTTSTTQHPQHTYQTVGHYTVALRAGNGNGPGAPKSVASAVIVTSPFDGSPYWYVGGDPANGYVEHTASEEAWAQEVLTLTNQLRAGESVAPLIWDDQAALAARVHSYDMAGRNYFAHSTPEGWTPNNRLQMTGATGYSSWGENIASGYSSPQAVVTAWRNSPGHWNNMKNPNFTHLGVGVRKGTNHWTQVFLRRN